MAGDLLVSILDDAPLAIPANAAADLSPAEFHARANDLAISAAIDGERVKTLLALVEEFLPLLLKLFGR